MLRIARNIRMIYLLLLKRAARLLKKALAGSGYCYLQCNQQSEFTHLTGAPILCQLCFISQICFSPFLPLAPPSLPVWRNCEIPNQLSRGTSWVLGRISYRQWAAQAKPDWTGAPAVPPALKGLLYFIFSFLLFGKISAGESLVAIGV